MPNSDMPNETGCIEPRDCVSVPLRGINGAGSLIQRSGFAFSRMTQESNTLWALAAAFVVAVFLTACSSHRPTSDGHSPHQERAVRPPERVRFPTKDGG